MDKPEGECVRDENQLNRNRSFKSKQLVRSEAIRESTSPPRTVSPSVRNGSPYQATITDTSDSPTTSPPATSYHEDLVASNGQLCRDDSSQDVRKTVEIQITSGGSVSSGYNNTESWCGRSDARLLSQAPRTACVCGACAACPHCRGKRRKNTCPTKQDSGIVCSEDCPDCSDTEHNGNTNDDTRKSIDNDDQPYCRCPERKDKPKSAPLTRTDSEEKQEPSGPELVNFLKETLNKNGRDRVTLLRIEKELHSFVNDSGRCIVKFPVMSSYGRMLVHRVAALFQLTHHIDHYNKHVVVVSKTGTSGGCIPCTGFKTWCVSTFPPSSPRHIPDNTLTKSILKRDTHSLDEPNSGASAMNRSKSLEQREKEYERVRRRIFSSDNCSQDESQWPWLSSGPIKLLTPDPSRNKLLKVQSLEGQPGQAPVNWRAKSAAVAKSHSFGGYVEHHRTLSRQGDLASSSWRLSPGSSGYKTLSVRSNESAPPSPSPPPPAPAPPAPPAPVVWCVTDLAAVPRGALLIHPQTGRPITNPDGSIYQYDPSNPPNLYDPDVEYNEEDKIDPNNEKRRGRLEKQHSFNDNDSECHQTDDCRSKCCECGSLETQAKSQEKSQETQKTTTPIKNRYEKPVQNSTPETTNHKLAEPTPTNQIPHHLEQQPITERDNNLTNQGAFDNQIQLNRSFEANQRNDGLKMTNQDTVFYPQAYNYGYNEEINSPPQLHQYMPADMSNMNMIPQAKVTPMQAQDPNIRPVSLTNMMYQPTVPQAYHYVPNQCRVDQLQQPMYQPMFQQQVEEQKQVTNSTQQETPFRIDPSYPYAPLEYGQCPCEPAQPQRSYSVYSQPEAPAVGMTPPQPYPMHNVILPHPGVAQYPVQYQEPVQWVQAPKLLDMCPVVYPPQYTHYNLIYPQMVPQPYPVLQPVYPVLDKQLPRKRTALPNSTRAQRLTTPDKVPYEDNSKDNDIEAKITQIKEQMANLNTRGGRVQEGRREDWRRNNGNGILGSYPHNNFNGRNHSTSQEDSSQLSSAARAIVNSIRNMQAKTTYQEKRYDNNNVYSREYNVPSASAPRPPAQYKHDARAHRPHQPYRQHAPLQYRQMTPSTWCRRSPAPVHPILNPPRRPPPDSRNIRR